MNNSKKAVALESRLKHCKNVITLGVRPNFSDYSEEEISLIMNSERVYYPSSFYADMFAAMGKNIFPSVHTYRFAQDKIKQTALFKLLNIPHPATRVFHGKNKQEKILSYFNFPFIGKIPRGSALGRGVFLLHDQGDLEQYCGLTKVAYIQEYLPIDRDIRAVIIGDRIAHAYWRINPPGEFRSNVGLGAEISFKSIPDKAFALALDTAKRCGWNDAGIDICECAGRFYVLEANMKYGKAGFGKAGIDYSRLMEAKIRDGEI